MKTFSHLYPKIISIENLFQAWEEFKVGKRQKKDVQEFESHLEDNLFNLHQELLSKHYRHSSYTSFYVQDPKVRHIHKAVVKDRIVHHAIFSILSPIFEPTFITESYSCRKGFGTHKGFEKLVVYSRKVSQNYIQDCWALKCDIKKFFASVDHQTLLCLIRERIKDPDLLWLLEEIVGSFGEGKGIPIGNLTSQLFANVYLNGLDQFVKHNLKVKYYLRYADDFVLLSQNRDTLIEYLEKLKLFLKENLNLELHPTKVSLRKLTWGIDFVGYTALPHYELVRTKTKKRIFRKIQSKVEDFNQDKVSIEALNQSIQSYLGVLSRANTYELKQELGNQIWFWLNNYRKLNIDRKS